MTLWSRLKFLLPSVRRNAERDMREELAALRELAGPHELGNVTRAAEEARDALTWSWLEQLAQDLRYGLRSMRHSKGFALLAVVSLGLGIGANTAIYSFFDGILRRPLPVADPESLVVLKWQARGYTLATSGMSWSTDGTWRDDSVGTIASNFPYPALDLFQNDTDVLTTAFGYFVEDQLGVTVGDVTDAVMGHYVSGTYFQGMGVAPVAGRVILPDDDREGHAAVAVISERLSRRRFRTPQAAVGQTIRLNDKPFIVAGVAPADFFGAEPGKIPDVYVPLRAQLILYSSSGASRLYLDQHYYWLEIMARLKAGVTPAQAHAVLAPRFHRFVENSASTDKERQDLPQLRIENGSLGLDSLRRQYARPIYVLMTMVGLVLVIACSNIASLLLARATARRREIAVRLSIGASRGRLIRQLLTESLLLSIAGGTVGVFVARWGIGFLTVLLSSGRENFTLHAELNWAVLGVTFAVSLASGVLFGLAPAVQATRVNMVSALKEGTRAGRSSPASGRSGLRHALVAVQVALAVVLLAAAVLFGRTLSRLHGIELGLARDNVLLFSVRPSTIGYAGTALGSLYENLRARLQALPGVQAVGSSIRPMPMGGGTMASVDVIGAAPPKIIDGKPERRYAVIAPVGPGFFETMQMPLIVGRGFTDRDIVGSPPAVVVNRQFAEVFGLSNPVGQIMTLQTRQQQGRYAIVGMVEDALAFTLKEERRPIAYFTHTQDERPAGIMTFEVRTSGHPSALAPSVREAVRQTDARLAIYDLTTQAAHVDQGISTELTLARLSSMFAVLALIIACIGVYGIIAFTVARRTTEIGIRMALGARASRIVWMVTRDAVLMTAAGVAAGLLLVFVGSRYVEALLYQTEPRDPVAIGAAAAGLLVAGLLAGLVPARRATRIDPLRAIRCE